MPLAEATDKAVNECIKEDILVEFLSKHRSEVKDLILTEYDEEKVRNAFYEDGREEGIDIGIERGIKRGIERGNQEKALEAARNLKEKGISAEVIAECVKLPLEVVKGL